MSRLETMQTQELLGKPFYKPGVGAATFALEGVARLLGAQSPAPPPWVLDRVAPAQAKLAEAGALRFDWDNRKKMEPLRRQGIMKVDAQVDRAVSAIYDMAKVYLDFEPSTQAFQMADELVDAVFPQGVWPITSVRFEEQHNKVNQLIGRLRGRFSNHVAQLNLGLLLDRLETLNAEYNAQLSALDNFNISYSEVQEAENAAIEAYFGVVLVIWASHLDDPATRAALLAPVEEQNTRLARHHRARRTPPRLDPDTGEELTPDEDDETGDTPVLDAPTVDNPELEVVAEE